MQPEHVAGIDRLEKSGYLSVLRGLVKSHTCPIWWYDDRRAVGKAILHNGTVAFVNTGRKVIAITANHVYEQYLKDKRENADLKCQFGNVTVEPEHYSIAADANVDVATFELPLVLAMATGVTTHNAGAWPPAELYESELIILGGYPGNRRSEKRHTVNSDFVSFISRVGQSSDDHLSIHLNMPESHWPQGERLDSSPVLGGISGGPVFRIRSEPLETIEFAGIIYESSHMYELVFMRHASYIQADGTLRQ